MTLDTNTLTIDDVNLDGMFPDDLWAFWQRTNSVRPIAFARQLFPTSPKGYVRAAKDLGNYAANKATAMKLRADGNIPRALDYENICERIYSQLPEYARW